MLQFLTFLAAIFPDYGASAHFRALHDRKMSINAVFAHFCPGSGLEMRTCPSYLQISLIIFHILERLLIFACFTTEK
jgi:uncharacterized membrane protein YhaH (DUF805 family)